MERVSLWYAEEALAVPQIVIALYRLARSGEGEWAQMAWDIRSAVVESESGCVEGLFRAFSGLAQKQLEGARRTNNPLFW